jgi:hypothetical protein
VTAELACPDRAFGLIAGDSVALLKMIVKIIFRNSTPEGEVAARLCRSDAFRPLAGARPADQDARPCSKRRSWVGP